MIAVSAALDTFFDERRCIGIARQKAYRWLVLCCWFTYMAAYLCRVNFSSAMETLSQQRQLLTEHAGLVGSAFYSVYAFGQLINGYIGDRVRPDRYILLALAGTMLCNVGMAFARTLWLMIVLWSLNGFFQSIFWSTIVRLLASSTLPSQRVAMSAAITMTMPIAYLVSWGLIGSLLADRDAKWYFLVPSLFCAVMACAWLMLRVMNGPLPLPARNDVKILPTLRFFREEGLLWLLPAAMFHGLVKEGAVYWMPLLVSRAQSLPDIPPFALVSILPVANLIGIIVSDLLLRRSGHSPLTTLMRLMLVIVVLCLTLRLHSSGVFMICLIALISAMATANNVIFMSLIPMQYTVNNMVASVVGVLDFSSYVGAAVSTYLLGKTLNVSGFAPVPLIWAAASAAGIAFIVPFLRRQRYSHSANR